MVNCTNASKGKEIWWSQRVDGPFLVLRECAGAIESSNTFCLRETQDGLGGAVPREALASASTERSGYVEILAVWRELKSGEVMTTLSRINSEGGGRSMEGLNKRLIRRDDIDRTSIFFRINFP